MWANRIPSISWGQFWLEVQWLLRTLAVVPGLVNLNTRVVQEYKRGMTWVHRRVKLRGRREI